MESNESLPLTITPEWLKEHDACEDQVTLFEEIWPDGAAITQEALATAASAGLNLEWLAERLFSDSTYADYEVQRALLYADYLANRAPAYADYRAKWHLVCDEFDARLAALESEYAAVRIPIYDEYKAKVAPLLVDILWAAYEEGRASLDQAT